MDPSSWLLILLYFVLLFFSAFFSAAETAFSSVGKIRLLNMEENEVKGAALARKITDRYDYYLTSLLVGNNLVNCAIAAVSAIFSMHLYTYLTENGSGVAESAVTSCATAVTTLAVFLFAEAIPKNYAKEHAESMVLSFAAPLRAFSVLLFPVTVLFLGISRLLSLIIRTEAEPTVTEEELSAIIEDSEESGNIDESQSELLQSALEYPKITVADVLTLRADIEWLDASLSEEQIIGQITRTRFSRLPVCDGTLDKPIGILIVCDYLKAYIDGGHPRLRRLIRKPYFTNLDASIDDLKDEMSGKRQHIALVRDRAGKSIIGMVTIEDFVEELVGEIYDEYDTPDADFEKLGGNYFRVSGRLMLRDLIRRVGTDAVSAPSPHKPVSTWILEMLGRIPEEGDEFSCGDLTVTIDSTEQNRVLFATVKKADPAIDAPAEQKEEEL